MRADLPNDVLATFDHLFAKPRPPANPTRTAMIVATADAQGRPSARTVLLKAHDARGFVFYTHLDGRKGRELQANPHAALLFHWPRVRDGVQVRIEGAVEIVDDAEADAYFASRPRGSQIGAWASLQSRDAGLARNVRAAPGRGRARVRRPRRAAPAALERLPRRAASGSSSGTAPSSACTSAGCTNATRDGDVVEADAVSVIAHAGPQRIVCLTEEPTEMLYALGEQDRIVGISGFTVRPAARAQGEAEGQRVHQREDRRDPQAAARISSIGFSDIQADIAAELIRHGVEVWISNHRSVDGILDYVRRLGALVGAADKRATPTPTSCSAASTRSQREAATLPRRPKVYFEEWDEPPITGIRWVAELVRIAGGDDIFPERAAESLAKHRILEDGDEVIRRAPDIILGSWCGKKFRPEKVAARPGWDAIPAVRDGELHEIKSPIILQPGPAALTDGVARDRARSSRGVGVTSAPDFSADRTRG